MGKIYTFYSYKGGVGRSMALANIAVLLRRLGYNVLMVDWDLEAPGLEFYFKEFLTLETAFQKPGIIDILEPDQHKKEKQAVVETWRDLLIRVEIPDVDGSIDLITAGKKDEHYFTKLGRLDIRTTYHERGTYIERLREEWKENYDYILIDSRTGITDWGGICTIHLPDILLLFITATQQSLEGTIEVADKARRGRKELPFDRHTLLTFPILSRFDSGEEFKSSQFWLDEGSSKLKHLYSNWLPKSANVRDFLETTKIPYVPYFSFGEKLPVVEHGTNDPASIGYAYETISALVVDNLQSVEQVIKNRDEFVRSKDRSIIKERIAGKVAAKKVFINYVRKDLSWADRIYELLSSAGLTPWMDKYALSAGEDWETAIDKAIRSSDIFIVCLSKNSVTKSGFQKELKIALEILDSRLDTDVFIMPLKLDDCILPESLSKFHYLDFSDHPNWSKLISSIQSMSDVKPENTLKLLEDKWLDLLEEGNSIKIKRQIRRLKDSIENCFFEMIELEGSEAPPELGERFWEIIDNICTQIMVLLKHDIKAFRAELLELLSHSYYLVAGPAQYHERDRPVGKQAELWLGLMTRVYVIGASALQLGKYDIINPLVTVRPKWNRYWAGRFWARHALTMYARSIRDGSKSGGLVALSNGKIGQFAWAPTSLESGSDDALEYLSSFDLLQCIISRHNHTDYYPSFGQFYNWHIEKTLIDIIHKRNSYVTISDIPDSELAELLVEFDEFASKEFNMYAGWTPNSFPDEVQKFIEKNYTKPSN